MATRRLLKTALALYTATYFVTFRKITGRSMSPCLNPNTDKERDIVAVDAWTPAVRATGLFDPYIPEKGSIVLATHPEHYNLTIVKRVAATAGEYVGSVQVPLGSVWLASDEPHHSILWLT